MFLFFFQKVPCSQQALPTLPKSCGFDPPVFGHFWYVSKKLLDVEDTRIWNIFVSLNFSELCLLTEFFQSYSSSNMCEFAKICLFEGVSDFTKFITSSNRQQIWVFGSCRRCLQKPEIFYCLLTGNFEPFLPQSKMIKNMKYWPSSNCPV